MITTANLPTARRLLASFNDAMQYKRAHNPTPMRDWMREAKPLVGIATAGRPLPSLVFYMIKVEAEKAEDAMSGARAMMASAPTALPALPETITIHLPPFARKRAEELAAATLEADRSAGRAPIAITLAALRHHEADLRDKAKRQAAWVMDDTVIRLLTIAAHVREAIDLIETHAIHDHDDA